MIDFNRQTAEETRRLLSNKEICLEYLFALKHPEGYRCKRCSHDKYHRIAHRGGSWECRRCGYQESVRVGTILQGSRLPLPTWILGVYEILSAAEPLTIKELQWRLGLDSYGTAWTIMRRVKLTRRQLGVVLEDLPLASAMTLMLLKRRPDAPKDKVDGVPPQTADAGARGF